MTLSSSGHHERETALIPLILTTCTQLLRFGSR